MSIKTALESEGVDFSEYMNINDDAYEVRIIMRDKKSINNL